ncbi:MAG: hypothetical protein AB7S48_00895 [Bacteroidales bacterium]
MEKVEKQVAAIDELVGGWSPYRELTAKDRAVFDEALNGFVGVRYVPQSVSTQLVSGTNYRFKCLASIPPSEALWYAIVQIYAPLQGKPYITHIQPL